MKQSTRNKSFSKSWQSQQKNNNGYSTNVDRVFSQMDNANSPVQ